MRSTRTGRAQTFINLDYCQPPLLVLLAVVPVPDSPRGGNFWEPFAPFRRQGKRSAEAAGRVGRDALPAGKATGCCKPSFIKDPEACAKCVESSCTAAPTPVPTVPTRVPTKEPTMAPVPVCTEDGCTCTSCCGKKSASTPEGCSACYDLFCSVAPTTSPTLLTCANDKTCTACAKLMRVHGNAEGGNGGSGPQVVCSEVPRVERVGEGLECTRRHVVAG